MAILGQTKSNQNLLRGISSFWQRFFKDKEILSGLFAATDQMMGQIYLELLEALLANSIETVPVFSKEFWKLITFSSDDVEIVGIEYCFPLTDNIKQLSFLYNKIFGPNTILENNQDFRIDTDNNKIYFKKNIFDELEFPGFARRREGAITIVSMWAPEALVDKEYVYEYYGKMLDIYEPSSESYKSFIRGIWFYYTNGPTINRIKSALNIIGGYPVATEDGEIVLSIKHVNNIYYIKTTVTVYEIPDAVELDIAVGDTLDAFQALTTAYVVTDYIDDPNWFDHIIVPIEVIPELTTLERTTNVSDPDPIFIGYPILIGTPGWYIGQGGFPNFMWLFFNQVLKYNIFYVTYNAVASQFFRSTEDLQDIVLSGKPAFDLAMVVPNLSLQDTVEEIEDTEVNMEMDFNLSNLYDLGTLGETLIVENQQILPADSYGAAPGSFGTPLTTIGHGKIGDFDLRLLTGVAPYIGTNTLGLPEDGLYTEFPIEIQVM
jgi:hypothetical protein